MKLILQILVITASWKIELDVMLTIYMYMFHVRAIIAFLRMNLIQLQFLYAGVNDLKVHGKIGMA